MSSPVSVLSVRDRLRDRSRWSVDPARSEHLWQRWRTAPWFGEGIAEWLAAIGTTEPEFRAALGATAPPPPARAHPTVSQDDDPDGSLTWFVKPIARARVHDLLAGAAREWGSAAWWPAGGAGGLEADLTRELTRRFAQVAMRCLITEVNARRLRGDFVSTTPAARAEEFAADLAGPQRLAELVATYPVLDDLWRHEADRWQHELHTVLTRLDQDHAALGPVAGADALGRLERVSAALGDPHRGGQCVRTLTFAGGTAVVYKPRPLTGEQWYGELVAALDGMPGNPGLRAARVLARDGWGWQELIRAAPVADTAEVDLFYRRIGWIIAASHAFSVIDLHAENLIAAGAHPVLVDLETVAHPILSVRSLDGVAAADETTAEYSVLLSMLLPALQWTDGVDLSAVGGGPEATMTVSAVVGTDGDAPRMAPRPAALPPTHNRPSRPDGSTPAPVDHVDEVLAGFRDGYRGLLSRRADLLAVDGPLLRRLRSGPLRYLARPTRVYAQALQQSTHPGLMDDAAERELYLSHLWGKRQSGPHRRLAVSEVEDLLELDVPVFTFRLDGRALTDSRGRRHPDFFPTTPLAILESHLASLSEQDLRAQEWAVEAALRAASERPRPHPAPADAPMPAAAVPFDRLIEGALDWLHRYRIRTDRGPVWFGMQNRGGRRVPDLVGENLYDGRAGIALFLAAAARHTGDRRARADAEAIARAVTAAIDQTPDAELRGAPPSLYEGVTGTLWGLVATLDLLGIEPPRALLARCAAVLAKPEQPDDALDVIGGSAGVALCAVTLSRRGFREFDDVADQAGQRLLATARATDRGLSWPLGSTPELGMTGFAHGNAGIAAALGRLHGHFGDAAYRDAAAGAVAWEDGHFDPDLGGWHDLRTGEVAPPYMVAWCHGSAGVVLGHAMAGGPLDPAKRALLLATVTGAETRTVGLCHGALGNIEALEAVLGPDPVARDRVLAAAGAAAERIVATGLVGDERFGMPTPGLMTGVAGIGFGLLRVLYPGELPSPLVMELP